MSSRLDLTPADLDRLEDALEDLELSSALEQLDADDPVAQRLSEYRELLLLGREAMPLEEVPAGLLDGVIAQARQAAAAAPAAAAPAPSFWARWRLGVWVPALAFAGSAALLLVVLVPKQGDAPARAEAKVAQGEQAAKESSKADAKAADGRLAFAEAPRQELELAEGEGALRGGGVAIGERAPEPAAAEPLAEEQAAAPTDEVEPEQQAPSRRKSATMGDTGAAPGAKPKPAPKAPSTSSGGRKSEPSPDPLGSAAGKGAEAKDDKADDGGPWSEIQRADSDRRGGSCGLAKMRYDKLRKLDDARVRARALAGAGLCAAASDDTATAKKLFDQARAADPDVSTFIDRELALLEGARTNAADQNQSAAD